MRGRRHGVVDADIERAGPRARGFAEISVKLGRLVAPLVIDQR